MQTMCTSKSANRCKETQAVPKPLTRSQRQQTPVLRGSAHQSAAARPPAQTRPCGARAVGPQGAGGGRASGVQCCLYACTPAAEQQQQQHYGKGIHFRMPSQWQSWSCMSLRVAVCSPPHAPPCLHSAGGAASRGCKCTALSLTCRTHRTRLQGLGGGCGTAAGGASSPLLSARAGRTSGR